MVLAVGRSPPNNQPCATVKTNHSPRKTFSGAGLRLSGPFQLHINKGASSMCAFNLPRRFRSTALAAAGFFLLATAPSAPAQEPEWFIKPTKEHELLKKDVGTWDATVKIWPMEGAPAMESKGTETNELLQGGLWIVSRFEGEAGGMPFTGVGTSGYDPQEKKFVGTWIDTMTPHIMLTKAEYDEESKTFTGTAEGRDAQTGQPYNAKITARYIDDDTRTFEMQMPGKDGKYFKMMEITYKRRAG
jgi:hypothetical protein